MLYTNALRQLDMQDISIVLLLIENRSAKRVSEILNLSQSSISYSLKKLRHCFDDKLFESSEGAMQPTARVLAMKPYLQSIMQCINQCAKEGAEQSGAPRQWNITAPEYFEILMLPTLLQQARSTGHNWSLSVSRLGRDLPINDMLSSDIDVCFGFGPGYHQRHPLLGTAASMKILLCVCPACQNTNRKPLWVSMSFVKHHRYSRHRGYRKKTWWMAGWKNSRAGEIFLPVPIPITRESLFYWPCPR